MNKDTLISNPIQGYAVYLEVARDNKTSASQFLFTPDGFNTNNEFVNARVYYRSLSYMTPRRQWHGYNLFGKDSILRFLEGNNSDFLNEPDAFTNSRMDQTVGTVLPRCTKENGWSVVFAPIVVEVSKKDLLDISNWKTPTKIIYRVQQVKKSVGFPETLQVA